MSPASVMTPASVAATAAFLTVELLSVGCRIDGRMMESTPYSQRLSISASNCLRVRGCRDHVAARTSFDPATTTALCRSRLPPCDTTGSQPGCIGGHPPAQSNLTSSSQIVAERNCVTAHTSPGRSSGVSAVDTTDPLTGCRFRKGGGSPSADFQSGQPRRGGPEWRLCGLRTAI